MSDNCQCCLDPQASQDLLKKLDEEESILTPGLTMAEQQKKLLETLEQNGGLSGLKDWSPELAMRAHLLLLKFHSVFSLEPNEMGCTDMTEHVIEVSNSELFWERFGRIVPPMVEEV